MTFPQENIVQEVIMVRHGAVDPQWKGICYGAMDVSLSEQGYSDSRRAARQLSERFHPSVIFHSGLSRTRFLAEEIAQAYGGAIPCIEDHRLRERDYGDWQGQTWDAAYASDPDNFDGLIEDPDHYRPPGGETTSQMQARVAQWFSEQLNPSGHARPKTLIAVSHSGPIAALAGHLHKKPPTQWQPYTIGTLESIRVRQIAIGEQTRWQIDRQTAGLR
ncbi:histidine phosphatase family protein [Rosistilla oblonga]|uniref:histidine phosphatase family protein n=1 Tax=Rosistilla oblonga TaxID=2527990 RepID=UPI003A973FC6